jgi:hypothetical protein
VLLPTGLIGVEELDVAYQRAELLLDHGLDGACGLVKALIDGRRGELKPQPIA